MQLSPYIFFDGRCEEALNFYARAFGGKITDLSRFEGSPMAEGWPAEKARQVMHATFEAPGVSFMASDGDEEGGKMSRVALSIGSHDVEEGRRIFNALAEGGNVEQAYEKMFWGATYGSLTDRFGIRWMVNAG